MGNYCNRVFALPEVRAITLQAVTHTVEVKGRLDE